MLSVMDNRYFYMTQSGTTHGPVWLGEMRRLWRGGQIGPETPVCKEGWSEWDPARTYPEITNDEARMPLGASAAVSQRQGLSWGVWALLLVAALFMVWVQFFYLRS
jgi:hypothetical protein